MNSVRKVYKQLPDVIKMPKKLQRRHVEVILLPLEPDKDKRYVTGHALSPLARFAGAWAGEALVREDQGNYEVRKKLK